MVAIAFLGLGGMGSRMAQRLADAGHELTVWNRTPAKAQPLVERGAALAKSPAAAADGADVVITMLADPAALEAVTDGPDGIAAGVAAGVGVESGAATTVVDMSTVGPDAVRRLAAALPEGTGVLDAPVLGSLREAEVGTLKVFVGGDAALAARIAPVLEALGTPLHVGPLGSGAAAKLVANTTLVGVMGLLGECLALADGLGLPPEKVFEVLSTTPLAAQAERRRPAVESGQFPPRFALSLARKDADLVTGAAGAAGVDVRLVPAAQSWFADAERAGLGDEDYAAVLQQIRGRNG